MVKFCRGNCYAGLDAGESSSTIVNVCVRSFGLSACRVITLRPATYVPDSYRAPNPEAAVEIIAATRGRYWSVAPTTPHWRHTHSREFDREGEPGAALLGHVARANPHSRLLSRRGRFSKPKLVRHRWRIELAMGFRPLSIERTLRVMADSLRRAAATESDA
jgi:hypothetical protein